jgi:two-component system response regulator HydG
MTLATFESIKTPSRIPRPSLRDAAVPTEFSGPSGAVRRLIDHLDLASRGLDPVLIQGETGSGKSLASRMLYELCGAESGWTAISADAFDERLCSRLVHERRESPPSLLAIEEVGDLSGTAQRRLLRLLSSREGPRVIATSSRDLNLEVLRGTFLRALLDRLASFAVTVPALRDRREDLPTLVERILVELATRYRKNVRGVSAEALSLLLEHSWGGNLRELRHELARALLLTPAGEEIAATALSPDLVRGSRCGRWTSSLRQRAREIERSLLSRVLETNGWNVSAAARELKISRVGLSKKLRVLEMKRPVATAQISRHL